MTSLVGSMTKFVVFLLLQWSTRVIDNFSLNLLSDLSDQL